MEYTGTIVRIKDTQIVSDKFKKREFVVTDGSASYAQNIQFELHQEKCDIIDVLKVGDEVNIKFNLRGRDWTNPQGEIKTFNTLQAWAIIKISQYTEQSETITPVPSDDLPF